MEDHDRFDDPQSTVTCPYNKAHTVTRFRMMRHLERCRKQHYELAQEFRTCPFNLTHVVPIMELSYHETVCADRGTFYNHTYHVQESANTVVEDLYRNLEAPLEIPCEENWDLEVDTRQNILAAVKESAENRGVLQSNSNLPKAERKAKRSEQRRKERDRMNEQDGQDASSSYTFDDHEKEEEDDDDDTSLVSGFSRPSTVSHISFSTARSNVVQRLERIQERADTSRGRGRGANYQTNNPQVPLGRGRKL